MDSEWRSHGRYCKMILILKYSYINQSIHTAIVHLMYLSFSLSTYTPIPSHNNDDYMIELRKTGGREYKNDDASPRTSSDHLGEARPAQVPPWRTIKTCLRDLAEQQYPSNDMRCVALWRYKTSSYTADDANIRSRRQILPICCW